MSAVIVFMNLVYQLHHSPQHREAVVENLEQDCHLSAEKPSRADAALGTTAESESIISPVPLSSHVHRGDMHHTARASHNVTKQLWEMRCPAPGELREKEHLLLLPGCCVVGESKTGKAWSPG